MKHYRVLFILIFLCVVSIFAATPKNFFFSGIGELFSSNLSTVLCDHPTFDGKCRSEGEIITNTTNATNITNAVNATNATNTTILKQAGFFSKKYPPSGFNSEFDFDTNKSFEEYVMATTEMIKKARPDLNNSYPANFPTPEQIVEGNAPFIFKPAASCSKDKRRGIILTHGLTDSPYVMRDLGRHFQKKCFTVFGILLTGNGTVPGDAVKVSYKSWKKLIEYAAKEMVKRVDELYLGGYSIGTVLSLGYANTHDNVEGLVLIAPALSFNAFARFAKYVKYFRTMVVDKGDRNVFKYESLTINAVAQLYSSLSEVKASLKKDNSRIKNTKIFTAISYQDDKVHADKVIQYILKNTDPKKSKVLIYNQENAEILKEIMDAQNVDVVVSTVKEEDVLALSHQGILVKSDDPWYGFHGAYRNCLHYKHGSEKFKECKTTKDIIFAPPTKEYLEKGIVARSTFDPLFHELVRSIDQFFMQ